MTTTMDRKRAEIVATLKSDYATYVNVFGIDGHMDVDRLNRIYKYIARLVHPDAGGDTEAFQLLNQFKSDADQMLAEGRYGEKPTLSKITTRKGAHKVIRKTGTGDIVTSYDCKSRMDTDPTGPDIGTMLRVAKSARDNDLMAAEAKALKALHAPDDKFTRAYPTLLDSFTHPEGRRRANVVTPTGGLTVKQLHEHFPSGLDPRHVVWIWRKLLMALGFAHDQGIIHGGILPTQVIILPEHHGVMLPEWLYSSTDGAPIKATVKGYRNWYPQEVLDKETPSAATDIAMAALVMMGLLGDRWWAIPSSSSVPKPLRAFFKGCLLTTQSMRPQDAWVLLGEFDELLKQMGPPFHPRRFVELTIP